MKNQIKFEKVYEDVKKLKEINHQLIALLEELEELEKKGLRPDHVKIRVELIKREAFLRLKDSEILEYDILRVIQNDRSN